jgi:hypothetical protein
MILLFRDSSVNFWLNNTIVDCGIAESQNNILDIELPEDISSDEIEENNVTNIEIINNKKLNKKLEHNQDPIYNESKHKKIYIGRNTKVTNGNSGEKDSRCKHDGYKYKYKDSNTRINNTQKTVEYQCVQKCSSTNFNQRKMREMPKTSNLYNYE